MRTICAMMLCTALFALAGCGKDDKAIAPNKTAVAAETNNQLSTTGGNTGGALDLTTGKVK
jgi:hypothetical protein